MGHARRCLHWRQNKCMLMCSPTKRKAGLKMGLWALSSQFWELRGERFFKKIQVLFLILLWFYSIILVRRYYLISTFSAKPRISRKKIEDIYLPNFLPNSKFNCMISHDPNSKTKHFSIPTNHKITFNEDIYLHSTQNKCMLSPLKSKRNAWSRIMQI